MDEVRLSTEDPLESNPSPGVAFRFDSLVTPGLDWTRIFISLTAGAGTR